MDTAHDHLHAPPRAERSGGGQHTKFGVFLSADPVSPFGGGSPRMEGPLVILDTALADPSRLDFREQTILHEIAHLVQREALGFDALGWFVSQEQLFADPCSQSQAPEYGTAPRSELRDLPLEQLTLTRGDYALEGLAEAWSQAVWRSVAGSGDPLEGLNLP